MSTIDDSSARPRHAAENHPAGATWTAPKRLRQAEGRHRADDRGNVADILARLTRVRPT